MASIWVVFLIAILNSKEITFQANADTICPCGWTKINDRCYFFGKKSASWPDSRKDCLSRGGDLTVPINPENNQHIYQAMKDRMIYQAWIGVHKVGNRFRTVYGHNMSYEYWYPGEPNNKGDNENCVEMIYKAIHWNRNDHYGMWNDAECSSPYRNYTCEMIG